MIHKKSTSYHVKMRYGTKITCESQHNYPIHKSTLTKSSHIISMAYSCEHAP